jgi:phosphatidylglycerophosphate synthase
MSTVQQVKRERKVKQRRLRKRWDTFTDWARAQAGDILNPVARIAGRLGIHPNTVTLVGFLLQAGVGVVFGMGHLVLGGWLLLIVAPVDALDGALARALGQKSRFGAFLDSTLDRLSDAALILGLTAHYLRQGEHLEVALLLISLVAAQMVSYIGLSLQGWVADPPGADRSHRCAVGAGPAHRDGMGAGSALCVHYGSAFAVRLCGLSAGGDGRLSQNSRKENKTAGRRYRPAFCRCMRLSVGDCANCQDRLILV